MIDRYGAEELADALPGLRHHLQRDAGSPGRGRGAARDQPVDLMIVIGGYNSSNTCNLARICAEGCPRSTLPTPTASCRRHHPLQAGRWERRVKASGWLPADRERSVG